jgi:hypothetical protein
VDQLLSQYEQAAGGKIKIVRVNSISSSAAKAAEADGIKARSTWTKATHVSSASPLSVACKGNHYLYWIRNGSRRWNPTLAAPSRA